MKSHVQVAVIGGGVVGCSVLYHLTKAGWKDVMLIERSELTSGSTWHAAGGFHTLNSDPNVAKLQAYTVNLYKEIEGHLRPILRAAPDRRIAARRQASAARLPEDGACARPLSRHGDGDHLDAAEAKEMMPLIDESYFVGAIWDPIEGHLDPYGTTHAYAKSARMAGRRSSSTTASPSSAQTATARGTSSASRGRSAPSMSSTPAASGRARSAGWSGWNCRCSPWSTITS